MLCLLYSVWISDYWKRSDNCKAGTSPSPPTPDQKKYDVGQKERVGFHFLDLSNDSISAYGILLDT